MKRFLLSSAAVFAPPGEEGAAAVEEQTPAGATPAEGEEGAAAEATAEESTEAEEEAAGAAAETEDWRDKEIRRKHAQLKERERELAELRKKASDLEVLLATGTGEAERQAPPAAAAMTPEEVRREAQRIAAEDRYKERLTNLNTKGETDYGADWGKALDRLTQFGELEDLPWIMEGVDNPAKVLVELGKNPAEYQRIMDLPPARRQAEYVRISDRQPVKAQPSKAPAPTDPVNPQRVAPGFDPYDEKTDDNTWFENRRKQKEERFRQRGLR